jgi:thiamine-phosphate pyrophosphorylase
MAIAQGAGIRFFQYRSKTGSRREIYDICLELSLRARETDSLFIVNDHADIAAAVGAAGVHLGQDDLPVGEARKVVGPGRIIGISTHSREQAIAAEQGGADYIGFGPVFSTATKDAGRVQGVETVRTIRGSVSIPIVAIGGITPLNMREVLAAGADAVAVISSVLSAPDMGQTAAEMVDLARNG